MKKIISSFILLLSFACTSWAYDFSSAAATGQRLYYDVVDIASHKVYVTYGGVKPIGYLVIPSYVTHSSGVTYTVIGIGEEAFSDCDALTGVVIPNSVTFIGSKAFYSCVDLQSVTFGNSVRSIGNQAFSGCTYLTSVTIPNSVTSIGDNAFAFCGSLTSVSISNSVTSIGYMVFYYCQGLISVTIPNSVTTIGNNAFSNCSGLTSVTIPNSVTSIGNYAFSYCSRLSVSIPNSVTSIGNDAFSGVRAVRYCGTAIGAPWGAHNAGCNPYSDGDFIFVDSTMTTLIGYTGAGGIITIPHTVTTIGNYAFYDCSGLTSVTIPHTVTTIGNYAFYDCSGLTSVTIPNSVTAIGDHAFFSCSGFTSITISNSVTTIGDWAFAYCIGLTSVTIPNFVTTIGGSAFYGCSVLTSVTIPTSVTTIGNYAFSSTSLNSVILECTTPPQIQTNTFPGSVTQPITFHVPCNTAEIYRNTDVWNSFYYQYVEDMGCPVHVRVFANDSTLGTVLGGGTYLTRQTVTLTATPKPNCHFVAWQDGNSQNPRVITIDSTDTYLDFTAIFAVDTYFVVTATPNDPYMGTVSGGGSYLARSTAMLCASPMNDCRFFQWNDGVSTNPRPLYVASDTTLIAIFRVKPDSVVVHDTTFVPYPVHDTTFVVVHDTSVVHDTTWQSYPVYDTTFVPVHDTTIVRDTTFVPVHDTTFVPIYDTTFVPIHDTTFVPVHDTTFVPIHDTTFVPVYDTTFVPIHDTTFVPIHDTTFIPVHDTAFVPYPVHDTTFVPIHDTTFVPVHDTIIVRDTTFVPVHDTIVIHDSVSSRLTYYGLSVFSSNLQRGVVAGNGRFPDSTVVEIAAIPIEGYRFVQWQDGNADNPRTVQLSGTDATFIATFEPSTQSIGTPQSDDDVTITTRNGQITVSNVANRTVRLFDSVGRLLSTSNTPDHTRLFTLPVSGVYLLQVGTAPARRVVVVK